MTPGHPFVVGEDAGKHHELTCPGGFRAGSQGGLPDTFGAATVPRPCTGLMTFLASPARRTGPWHWVGDRMAHRPTFPRTGTGSCVPGVLGRGWPGSSWVSSSEGPAQRGRRITATSDIASSSTRSGDAIIYKG